LIGFLRGLLINHDTPPIPAAIQSNPVAPFSASLGLLKGAERREHGSGRMLNCKAVACGANDEDKSKWSQFEAFCRQCENC